MQNFIVTSTRKNGHFNFTGKNNFLFLIELKIPIFDLFKSLKIKQSKRCKLIE